LKHLRFIRFLCLLLVLLCAAPAALAYEKLEKGAAGSQVLAMQQALASLGFEIETDGKYGAATARVVKAFQRQHDLTADGVAGNKTLSLLYALAPAYAAEGAASPAAPTAAPAQQAGAALTAVVVTTGGSLNLRKDPRDYARVLTTIPCGAAIAVTARGEDWCAVSWGGYSGYAMTKFLSFGGTAASAAPTASPAAPTAAPVQQTGAALTAVVATTGGSLNLRKDPRDYARVLTTIPCGAAITVTARGGDWCAVSWGGYSGYAMTKFLSFGGTAASAAPTASPAAPTAAPAAIPQGSGGTAYVSTTGGSLNLRAEARSTARVLTTIPNGTALTLVTRGDTWCGVIYGGRMGFVMTAFLAFSAAAPTAVPTAAPTIAPTAAPFSQDAVGTGLVTTSGGKLNLREAPRDTARVIAEIPNAAALTVTGRGDTWCSVVYNGQAGYVMTKFITVLGGAQVQENPDREEDPSAFTRVLKKGMTGADVQWVQGRLLALGYTLTASNVYDDATFAAVRAFQTQNGLTADGLAGSQTFAALKSDSARQATAAPLSYSTLRIDDTGDGVRQIQTDLKALGYPVSVNGTYDTATHNAVVAFQQRNALTISGIADALTRQVLHGGAGKPYSTPVSELPADAGKMAAPAVSQLKLLHWQNEIKPSVKAGQSFTVCDPNTGLGWTLVFYSLGRHADSQPASWRDTQIMNRSFGSTSWNIHPVYVKLPSGQWTLATMHNRPHLYGTISDNGFGGHLCVHFLRDMAEAQKNDPNYGVNNQVTLRNAWKALTGETVD